MTYKGIEIEIYNNKSGNLNSKTDWYFNFLNWECPEHLKQKCKTKKQAIENAKYIIDLYI